MQIISNPTDVSAWSLEQIRAGQSIALVPTMGFFHEGHLALMRTASEKADKVVVSLFVNPLQFGPAEDLDSYPKDIDRDAELAEKEGVDVLFLPGVEEMYNDSSMTSVSVRGLTEGFCGKSRSGHFDGVCTVVAKLFNIVMPTVAVFGCKDFQQLAVIRRMVQDLNWNLKIIAQPTIRENDGLAMSSRNSYLSAEERQQAVCLFKTIQMAKKLVSAGMIECHNLLAELESFIGSFDKAEIDYMEIVDNLDLKRMKSVEKTSLLVMAVKIGKTRLIDNSMLM